MTDDKQTAAMREAFEAWCLTQGWVERPSSRENGTYINGTLQARWTAWQAATAQATAAQWMPIETAPKEEGVWILAMGCYPDLDLAETIRWIHGGWDDGWGSECLKPTHYMPLPPSPVIRKDGA